MVFEWDLIIHFALLFADNDGALIASVAFRVTEI
jgi:hypothetical protein